MLAMPRFETMATNGIALRVARLGPEGGPPVILLHGFPEPWFAWRHQIGPLADAGLHVLAPDQRGYGGSDKPDRVASYALDVLTEDVLGLIAATGRRSARLVGHDWGGIVAWWTALRHPERVERLAILNAPHPVIFRRYVVRHPSQMLRSWYVGGFQVPWLPERLLRRGNWRALTGGLVATSRPGTFSEADLDRYRGSWSEPGAIRAMIHWYRAGVRHRPDLRIDPRIRVPTLVIWGLRDRFLSPALAEASVQVCAQGRLETIASATHWIQHEEPDRVNRLLIDFLAPHGGSSEPAG